MSAAKCCRAAPLAAVALLLLTGCARTTPEPTAGEIGSILGGATGSVRDHEMGSASVSTTLELTGTPGSTFYGSYHTGRASRSLSGAIPTIIQVPRGPFRHCEIRKGDPNSVLLLEIRRGGTPVVQATAEPGALGVRASNNGGWQFEVIR